MIFTGERIKPYHICHYHPTPGAVSEMISALRVSKVFMASDLGNVVIKSGTRLRRVFKVFTEDAGDIYLTLFNGMQVGIPPNAVKVSEARYSIHPSLKSLSFNQIKKTLLLENKRRRETVMLTNAIKESSGLSMVFSTRLTDLESQFNDVPECAQVLLNFGEVDVSRSTLFVSMFVGNQATPLPEQFHSFSVGKVRFAFLIKYATVPASEYGQTLDFFTSNPENFPDEGGKQAAREKMLGRPITNCLTDHSAFSGMLLVDHLKSWHEQFEGDPDMQSYIRKLADTL